MGWIGETVGGALGDIAGGLIGGAIGQQGGGRKVGRDIGSWAGGFLPFSQGGMAQGGRRMMIVDPSMRSHGGFKTFITARKGVIVQPDAAQMPAPTRPARMKKGGKVKKMR